MKINSCGMQKVHIIIKGVIKITSSNNDETYWTSIAIEILVEVSNVVKSYLLELNC